MFRFPLSYVVRGRSSNLMLSEVEYVTGNTLTNRRNKPIVFTTVNVCRIGLNYPSNRLRSVSNVKLELA
jgi:hypothetical protein